MRSPTAGNAQTPAQAAAAARAASQASQLPTNLSGADMIALVNALQQFGMLGNGPTPTQVAPVLHKPRVGGTDSNGVWTGEGKGKLGLKPKSGHCYRQYAFGDKAKALSELNKVESFCKAGLKDLPKYHFQLPLEQGTTDLPDCLLEFKTFTINTGMEGIFLIQTQSGKTINMFREYGQLSDDIISTWTSDLACGMVTQTNPDGSVVHKPPCDYDKLNLEWSGDALINTCSAMMKKTIERQLSVSARSGASVLWCIISNCETSSSGVVRDLCQDLKSMSLRSIQGENVQVFAAAALEKVALIRSKCQGSPPDNLTQLALRGLTDGTDEGIRLEAKQLLREADKPSNSSSPEEVLQTLVKSWKSAVDLDVYGPHKVGKPSTGSAFLAGETRDMPTIPQVDPTMMAIFQAMLERSGQSRGPLICHNCGGENHMAKDCVAPRGHKQTQDSSASTATREQRMNKRGLSAEESARINQLIREFELPTTIGDKEYISVKDSKGEVVG